MTKFNSSQALKIDDFSFLQISRLQIHEIEKVMIPFE